MKKVLLLGSGALKIGQAGEFDYSGSQALKTLKEEGISTVLLNPNIATVQTSETYADKIYFLPVNAEYAEKVIEKERPDGILLSFGGQTALNCGVELWRKGILDKYGVKVLGTPVQTIEDTEDRERFVARLSEIGVKTISSHPAGNLSEALQAASALGYPVIVRAAYALGGLGSGFASCDEELNALCDKAFSFSPQVLIEKSLKGWKEIEYEVVRDRYGNSVTICNMENLDPLGIHTGESIVVAPSQTLSNKDYHFLRELSLKIVAHLGIVGECNVQFAYDPLSTDYRVIEVNARLSRSSALASKATAYPLAAVAARLSLGYGLAELVNPVTGNTSAFFEPALDYVVCKIPRWDLAKFSGVSHKIGTGMKSVGEVMGIGRSFEEALQKGLRMIGQGSKGFTGNSPYDGDMDEALSEPTDRRIFIIADALQQGYSPQRIHSLTGIDLWFLEKLSGIAQIWKALCAKGAAALAGPELLKKAKCMGFSDSQIALATGSGEQEVRKYRKQLGILPVVKQIDTLAAEFPARTNYLYLTYNGSSSDIAPEQDGKSVIVLGSGAYRIGSSVEFDWCSVTSLDEVRRNGWRGVMINYNPETVSTDYDSCDRLYFEELSLERVLDIAELEAPYGVIVSVGGQIPNNLALSLRQNGIPILGTSATDIDRAEDRHKFSEIVDALGIDQPEWSELTDMKGVDEFIAKVGYPVLVRPSYVLSGAAMNVCHDSSKLEEVLSKAAEVSAEHPVVLSKFISKCKEIEFDAVADDGKILAYAISEHLEYAGVHSGDATIVFPAQKLYVETVRRVRKAAAKIAAELKICGPFNIQFLAKDNVVKVIECNLRASRSFPFVSKVLKLNFIRLATKAMLGLHPEPAPKAAFDLDYIGVKASQFSFARLQGADPLHGVDMASTGEAACLATNVDEALLKAMIAVGNGVGGKKVVLSSGNPMQKAELLPACRMLDANGFEIYATEGSWRYLYENGIKARRALWPSETANKVMAGTFPQVLELIKKHEVDMVVNIPKNFSEKELADGFIIRRTAIDSNIPLFTDGRLASAYIRSLCTINMQNIEIKAWDEY
ncbi:MAG: carbamoyl-phosphate synthase (glutamine-hydrolyzing) large subunit [Bacteroidales bacterium]|nr:carbamoyl-phosphate synthase (glutamine-hydrolyzing) large subunit [Bacteroidales bacterium]